MTTPFLAAARAYWSASGVETPLPELPDAPLDAFIELLDRSADQPEAYVLVDVSRDPYPGMALGDSSAPWAFLWAVSLAQLEAFRSPREPERSFLVDTVADPKGMHRVYTHGTDEAEPLAFASLVDALYYMAAELEHARGLRDAASLAEEQAARRATLKDAWEQGPSSGRHVLEGLLALPFPDAWDALSRGEWPVVDSLRRPFRGKGKPGWQRAFTLWLIERFLESRMLTLPKGVKASELDAAHRELVRQIAALEESLHTGLVPELIEQLSVGPDAALAEAASAWIERFDAWAAASEPPPGEPGDEELHGDSPFDPMKLAELLLGKRPDADRDEPAGEGAEDAAPALDPAIAPVKRAAKPKKGASVLEALLAPEPEPEPELEETPFTRKLRVVVGTCLDEMVRDEVIELGEGAKEALVAELVEAAADSRSAQHMLKQLTRTLVASDHVEEIYASDDEVSDLFRATMER